MLSINAEPGFLSDVFFELNKLPLTDRDCNLVLNGMAIRKQLIWDQQDHCYKGYCDYGNSVRLEGVESEATEALLFMLVGLNRKWKWPVEYFLKSRMSALTQVQLVKSALTLSKELGLKVWSVTCDGTSVNFSMFEQLGYKIFGSNYENIQSKFKHPSANYYVYAIGCLSYDKINQKCLRRLLDISEQQWFNPMAINHYLTNSTETTYF